MKQFILFKKIMFTGLCFFIASVNLFGQTIQGEGRISAVYNNTSCGAAYLEYGQILFPGPQGLTLGELNHLSTDFIAELGYFNPFGFKIRVEIPCGSLIIRMIGEDYRNPIESTVWKNTGNLATPGNGLIEVYGGCNPAQSFPTYGDVQAEYGSYLVTSIVIFYDENQGGTPIFFDNTQINSRLYDYDDCDDDGLLDIYDCDPAHGGNNKVLVCHNGQTICVAQSALQTHLNHGDFMGSCSANARPANNLPPEEVSKNEIKLYPNPANNQINIRNYNNKALGTVSIYDISGKMIYNNFIGSSRATIDIKKFSPGVYWLRSDQMEKPLKFVKQ